MIACSEASCFWAPARPPKGPAQLEAVGSASEASGGGLDLCPSATRESKVWARNQDQPNYSRRDTKNDLRKTVEPVMGTLGGLGTQGAARSSFKKPLLDSFQKAVCRPLPRSWRSVFFRSCGPLATCPPSLFSFLAGAWCVGT